MGSRSLQEGAMRPQNFTLTARRVHRCAATILQDHLHLHAYATLYVIRAGYRFTVALTAVSRGEPLEEVLKRLLRQAAAVGIRCRLLLLDRGFYSVGVIRYLQAARHPFLMPVICRGRQLDDARGPSGTNVFLTWEKSGFGTYTLHDARKRPARVSICVKCRYYRGQWRRHGKQRLIYAVWGLVPPSFDWVKETYRQRFAIEINHPHYVRNHTLYQPEQSGYGWGFGVTGAGTVVPQAA